MEANDSEHLASDDIIKKAYVSWRVNNKKHNQRRNFPHVTVQPVPNKL